MDFIKIPVSLLEGSAPAGTSSEKNLRGGRCVPLRLGWSSKSSIGYFTGGAGGGGGGTGGSVVGAITWYGMN
jgi:hypothetical protein